MKPFKDEKCICLILEKIVNDRHPECDWNIDNACDLWGKFSNQIINNNIGFDKSSDECYGCTCPRCGRLICGWCV